MYLINRIALGFKNFNIRQTENRFFFKNSLQLLKKFKKKNIDYVQCKYFPEVLPMFVPRQLFISYFFFWTRKILCTLDLDNGKAEIFLLTKNWSLAKAEDTDTKKKESIEFAA